LLKTYCKSGPISVRALSKELNRDYKNVHIDVKVLEQIGLIDLSKDGKIKMPIFDHSLFGSGSSGLGITP